MGGQITARYVKTFTPADAEAILARTTIPQRPIRKAKVKQYAEHMRRGMWAETGDAVALWNGQVINGQHRLRACVLAGVPFTTDVHEHANPSVFAWFDASPGRSTADAVFASGMLSKYTLTNKYKHALTVAAGIAMRFARLPNDGAFAAWGSTWATWYNQRTPHHNDVVTYIRDNDDRIAAAARVAPSSDRDRYPLPFSYVGALAMLASDGDQDANQKAFFEPLRTGVGLEHGSPVLALRNRAFGVATQRERINTVDWVFYAVRAWNAYAKGDTLIKFSAPRGEFPVLLVPLA